MIAPKRSSSRRAASSSAAARSSSRGGRPNAVGGLDDLAVELVHAVDQDLAEARVVGGADHALIGELAAQQQPVEPFPERPGGASRSRTAESASPSQARICLSTSCLACWFA